MLDAAEIRGQLLNVTDLHGIQHKRGPSKWQQQRHQMERNLASNRAKNNAKGMSKWLDALRSHEQTEFDFDFGTTGAVSTGPVDIGTSSGGAAGAVAGGSALGAPSGAVLGAAGGLAHNAASSALGCMSADGVAVREQQP